MEESQRMTINTPKIALITGASRGLGAHFARQIGRQNIHCILAARTVGGLEEVHDAILATGGTATIMPLDLRKLDDVAKITPVLLEKFGRLDLLAHMAAMLPSLTPIAQADPRPFDEAITVNLLASQRLVAACDPLLRMSAAPQALFVTDSRVSKGDKAYWGGYAIAKAGLEAMIRLYQAENANGPVRVYLESPEPMATKLRFKAYPGEAKDAHPSPEETATRLVKILNSTA